MYLLSFLLFISSPSPAKILKSGAAQVNVLELYSSEGCSSCPPADKWLGSLKKHPKLWKSFIPIEFHVDYWNQLGWTDPFSTKTFTHRQRSYSREWNSGRIYTPGFVLNGMEWKPRNQEFSKVGSIIGELNAEMTAKNKFKITFTPKNKTERNYRLFATLLGNGLITRVPRGENAGRTLQHEFVVLDYKQKNLEKKKGHFIGEIELQSKSKKKPRSFSVAFWVTDGKSLKPIQAVGGDI